MKGQGKSNKKKDVIHVCVERLSLLNIIQKTRGLKLTEHMKVISACKRADN